jgi:hypothetical protein
MVVSISVIYHFFSNSETRENPSSISKVPETPDRKTESKNKLLYKIKPSETIISKTCSKKLSANISAFAYPKWQQFKTNIYAQGIKYPVLLLAVSEARPIAGSNILKRKIANKKEKLQIKPPTEKPQEFKKKLNGLLYSQRIKGIIKAVENGEIPQEVFAKANHRIFVASINNFKHTQIKNILPNEDELLSLVEYGLEITAKDYAFATTSNVPVEFMKLLISLGPVPEDENNLHDIIPLDIAAKNGNLELMDLWLENNYSKSNRLIGGNFSDTLLLNSSTAKQLNDYWDFLNNRNQHPRDPKTAQKLLSSKIYKPSNELEQFLLKLAKQIKPKITLNDIDKPLFQIALSQIESINQIIANQFPDYLSCEKLNTFQSLIRDPSEWVMKQIYEGKSVEDILKSLSLKSPMNVDIFRAQMNAGVYSPRLKRSKYYSLLKDSASMEIYGLALLKDWDEIKAANDAGKIDDTLKLYLISDSSNKMPKNLKDDLINTITRLPIQSQKLAAKALDINQFEAMQPSNEFLNQVDDMGKNIFYYAAKNNKVKLMQWLAQKNINMDADPYGVDPLDSELLWKTNPQTLNTLCSLGFPIKQKHRKRLDEIRKYNSNEAEIIVANCPAISE